MWGGGCVRVWEFEGVCGWGYNGQSCRAAVAMAHLDVAEEELDQRRHGQAKRALQPRPHLNERQQDLDLHLPLVDLLAQLCQRHFLQQALD